MSVVLGKLSLRGEAIDQAELSTMLSQSNHFNADAEGLWKDEMCGLGHLKIINTPESVHERLPYYSSNFQLAITADARLDNRNELLTDLRINDSTISDSQLILLAYKKYQESCVDKFVGAFAFAIWDQQKQKLFCARDHLGLASFFYYHDENFFAFASEKKGLLALKKLDKSINHDFLINQLTISPQKYEDTFYKHIHRLTPAHTLSIDLEGHLHFARYWDLDSQKTISFNNQQDYIDGFLEKLNLAISSQLRTIKEVGVELSGGLDSSGLAALAHQQLSAHKKRLHCYSMIMPREQVGKVYPYSKDSGRQDEWPAINDLCDFIGIPEELRFPIITDINPDESYLEELDRGLDFKDGVDDYYGPRYPILKRQAQQHGVGVIFAGFGGDELATAHCRGYYLEYFERKEYANFIKAAKPKYPWLSWGYLLGLEQLYDWKPEIAQKLDRLVFPQHYKRSKQFYQKRGFLSEDILKEHPELRERILQQDESERFWTLKEYQKKHVLRSYTYLTIESLTASARAYKMDMRFPLLDIGVLEYVLALPVEQKHDGVNGRLLFRRAMEGILPSDLIWRKKQAFGASNPSTYLDYQLRHQEVMEWLSQFKDQKRYSFVDIDKLMHKASVYYDVGLQGRVKVKEHPAGAKQGLMHALMRYMELNPNFTIQF